MRKSKPAEEKGVQMESDSRCASRSDAGTVATAFDLCKHGRNLMFGFEKVKENSLIA
jgi:hypothetical protein